MSHLSLSAYAAEHGHFKYAGYFPVFDDALRGATVRRLLEIGCSAHSLQTWLDCFPDAEIVALDANDLGPTGQDNHYAMAEAEERFTFVHADQADVDVLRSLGAFDVVVDDGGHRSFQQVASFTELFPRMPSGGWYFIEDLHCSYMESYQDKGHPTTMRFLKTLLDDLHSSHFATPREQEWPIAELRFVDSLVAMRRQ